MPVLYDRAAFYARVRGPVFRTMAQSQVDGCEAILAEAERRALPGTPMLAYMLATVFWETAETMRPIREIGLGRGRAYGVPDPQTGHVYYGRGLVQLTWKANYAKMAALCGADLVGDPDRALGLDIAVKILFDGMLGGLFTGKKLADYITASTTDYVGARRIINGTDQANTIASFARQFEAALIVTPSPAKPSVPPLKIAAASPSASSTAPVAGLVGWVKSLFAR